MLSRPALDSKWSTAATAAWRWKAAGGRHLSIAANGNVSLTNAVSTGKARGTGIGEPVIGDSEKFLWVNLLRGHVMLMSLANHHYLTCKSDAGDVTTTATGPKPDRKDGACFAWKVVE